MTTTPTQTNQARPASKQRAGDIGDRIGSTVDKTPLVALAGAAVVGAVAGALLPRTDRETELFGSVGNKLGKAAGDAVKAARDVGKQELGLLTGEQSPLDNLVQKALGAVSAAGSAAATSITSKRGG